MKRAAERCWKIGEKTENRGKKKKKSENQAGRSLFFWDRHQNHQTARRPSPASLPATGGGIRMEKLAAWNNKFPFKFIAREH